MRKKPLQKLELTWIGKGDEHKLEPRILIEQPEYSYGDKETENMIIHGDNLLALKALEQEYANRIKCIYIDPPYNTGSAFEHYNDGLEHSIWLSLISDRIKILKNLLSENGSIWINLDDNEAHYCKVVCDEIFGRSNFVANVLWQKRTSPDFRATLGAGHDHLLVFAKDKTKFKTSLNKLPLTLEQKSKFKNPDNDPRGPWVSSDFTAQGFRPNQMYEIKTPGGKSYYPPEGNCWKNIESVFLKLYKEGRMWFGKTGKGMPRRKTYLNERDGRVAWTWWTNKEVGHTQESKKEILELFGADNAFDTPKPERLLERIITLSSNEGDIILDSFLGSGTTTAVAHKMKRKYIGIELGNHAYTHCFSRMKKVVVGEQGGISKSVDWKGGGGFKFYTLAPSLLKKDKYDNWIIDGQYNADMLAAAMAKQEGFSYQPDGAKYWKQGNSSEQDFIYTTTQFVTVETLAKIKDEMKPNESLLICCKAFSADCKGRHGNITIKKIPQMLLGRCEFGKDDYSLNIIDSPLDREVEDIETITEDSSVQEINVIEKKKQNPNQKTLFD